MRYLIFIITSMLLVSIATASDKCIPHNLAIEAWSEAFSKSENPINIQRTVLAVCNPCSCPQNGMAACYDYMAREERAKYEKQLYMRNLIDQAAKYGICERATHP